MRWHACLAFCNAQQSLSCVCLSCLFFEIERLASLLGDHCHHHHQASLGPPDPPSSGGVFLGVARKRQTVRLFFLPGMHVACQKCVCQSVQALLDECMEE